MTSRERRIDQAAWRMRRDVEGAGDGLRQARLQGGLTIKTVAAAIGASPSVVLRTEQGIDPGPRPLVLARHAAAVGMRARILLYPHGTPLRDAGHLALIARFKERIGRAGRWAFEVPVGQSDMRALDAVVTVASSRCGIEFFTRFSDCQAQLRLVHQKQLDASLERMVVVVSATHANRRAVQAAREVIEVAFPLSSRAVLAALAAGTVPDANGIAFL